MFETCARPRPCRAAADGAGACCATAISPVCGAVCGAVPVTAAGITAGWFDPDDPAHIDTYVYIYASYIYICMHLYM